jgi:hypothetical protein
VESPDFYCWGRDDFGQLGVGAPDVCRIGDRDVACGKTPEKSPFPMDGSLLVGDLYTCVMRPRDVVCWGASRDGFFGAKDACDAAARRAWPTTRGPVQAPAAACSPDPVSVPGMSSPGDPLSRASAGPRGLCVAPYSSRRVVCTGAIPTPKIGAVRDVKVSPGDDASACALGAAGDVLCWGESYSPPDAGGEAAYIPLGPPPASPDASVFDPPHAGAWEDIHCQIHQPCEHVPARLPRCPDGYEAKDWSQIEPWKLDGQTVTVRGPLVASRRLQSGGFAAILGIPVPSGPCGAQVAQAPIVIGGLYQELAIESLWCRGDESRLCCDAPAQGQTVIATGRLVDREGLRGRYELHDAKLCVEGQGPSR